MKNGRTNTKLVSLIAFLLICLSFVNSAAADTDKYDNAVKNLIMGITSDNEGLKRSCIYLAGKYEYTETINALTNQLLVEKNPSTRLLIAHALFKIGDVDSMIYVKQLSYSDVDPKVRRIAEAIYQTFESEVKTHDDFAVAD